MVSVPDSEMDTILFHRTTFCLLIQPHRDKLSVERLKVVMDKRQFIFKKMQEYSLSHFTQRKFSITLSNLPLLASRELRMT